MFLLYVYPIRQYVTFTYIARCHVDQMVRRGVQVFGRDWGDFWNDGSGGFPKVVLHPLWYPFIGVSGERAAVGRSFLERLSRESRLAAFDVVESDGLSETAVEIANRLEFLCVPSTWSARMAVKAGVRVPVYTVPHGVPRCFSDPPREPRNPRIAELRRMRREKGIKLVFFNLYHSGWRKGSDLVKKIMERVQARHPEVRLLIKRRPDLQDPFLGELRKVGHVEFAEWLPPEDLRDLYDSCDACLVMSRGGGFELVSVEAGCRGIPTLVPEDGCFLDYCRWLVPVRISGHPPSLPGNPIHTGAGWEADWEDAAEKLLDVIENPGPWGERMAGSAEVLRRSFTWERAGEAIRYALRRQGWL
jgi:glycosyltransferase involved in cell wall biosynthesis